MEAAGLAVGIIALASLFKDCIDLFSYISTARQISHDHEILDTMLDVEKTIFLQWADRVGLLNQDNYHILLDKPDIRKSVSRILVAIQGLLGQGQGLQHRFGLRPADEDELTDAVPVISGPRTASFIRGFETMTLRTAPKDRNIPMFEKFRWVVRDKEKFDGLLKQLTYFNSRLNDLIPDFGEGMVLMAKEDVEDLRSVAKMRLVLEATANRQETIAAAAQQMITESCQRRILQSLWYRNIDLRKDQVSVAHEETLRWALEPKGPGMNWDDLCTWLQHGQGIYWVSGKPGSGKSTLMKYLYGHDTTCRLLEIWSGEAELTMASFFFWSLGTPDQRSQQGLLRALLYNVVASEPILTDYLLPNMWKEAQASQELDLSPPSLVEMEAAFERLTHQITTRKYCFIIDGLDEFAGKYEDTIRFLKNLVQTSRFKVIVSSRPIPACEEAFSSTAKLRLHDLTRDDIESYVRDAIGSHSYLSVLFGKETSGANRIVNDITRKASGVFLWVVLACRSLLDGFAAFDHLSDIQNRIDELPPELGDLFHHILDNVEPRYRTQAAKMLRLCYESRLSNDVEPLQTLGLALIDDGKMSTAQLGVGQVATPYETKAKCEALDGRLRSRCCGLLEVRRATQASLEDQEAACFCQAKRMTDHDTLLDSTVEFMHRTVFEFLDQPRIWQLDCLQIHDDQFDAAATMAHMSLELACFTLHISDEILPRIYFKDMLSYGLRADSSASDLLAPVLRKFENALGALWDVKGPTLSILQELNKLNPRKQGEKFHLAFLFALEAGMENFASSYLELGNLTLLPDVGRPLLLHILYGYVVEILCSRAHTVPTSTLRLLLHSGCDANQEICLDEQSINVTPWKIWLGQMSCHNVSSAIITASVTELFIHNNADIKRVEEVCGETLPQKIKRLLVNFGYGWSLTKDQRYIVETGRRLLHLVEQPLTIKRPLDIDDYEGPPRKYNRSLGTSASGDRRQLAPSQHGEIDAI